MRNLDMETIKMVEHLLEDHEVKELKMISTVETLMKNQEDKTKEFLLLLLLMSKNPKMMEKKEWFLDVIEDEVYYDLFDVNFMTDLTNQIF